jgi:hypothetical protein
MVSYRIIAVIGPFVVQPYFARDGALDFCVRQSCFAKTTHFQSAVETWFPTLERKWPKKTKQESTLRHELFIAHVRQSTASAVTFNVTLNKSLESIT